MARRVVFTGKQEVSLQNFEPDDVGEGKVLLRSIMSLMSTGTENICFNRLFEPGTHWDRWVKYPFFPGYSMVSVVEKVGAGVTSVKPGDRVVARLGHASHHLIKEEQCYPCPAEIDPKQAAWFALAKITFMGAKAAEYRLGDNVLIIGAGPIGQMSIRWANAAGAQRITVVDMVEQRLAMAKMGGATAVVTQSIDKAADEIIKANGGQAPNVIMDTTGNEHVFAHALGVAPKFGRVIIMGDTGAPSQQRLSSDVMVKGLRITAAHDSHEDETWKAKTIYPLFFTMVTSGRMNLNSLNTHTFAPEECKKAYEVANTQRGQTMGILFDWSK
jgi:2-desacetyl-2-hydroxyethyl bacteriochlorophyllide A dehydrogenase